MWVVSRRSSGGPFVLDSIVPNTLKPNMCTIAPNFWWVGGWEGARVPTHWWIRALRIRVPFSDPPKSAALAVVSDFNTEGGVRFFSHEPWDVVVRESEHVN